MATPRPLRNAGCWVGAVAEPPLSIMGVFPLRRVWKLLWGGSRTTSNAGSYCGAGAEPPAMLEVIVGREPNHQQSGCRAVGFAPPPPAPQRGECHRTPWSHAHATPYWAGAEPPAMLEVGYSALPRPPQPPRGGNATARRGPTHKSHAVFGGCRLDVSKTKPYST